MPPISSAILHTLKCQTGRRNNCSETIETVTATLHDVKFYGSHISHFHDMNHKTEETAGTNVERATL